MSAFVCVYCELICMFVSLCGCVCVLHLEAVYVCVCVCGWVVSFVVCMRALVDVFVLYLQRMCVCLCECVFACVVSLFACL